jgi:hypothetical protein
VTVYVFTGLTTVIPDHLLDAVFAVLQEHVECKADQVDPDLKAFVAELGQVMADNGPYEKMDMGFVGISHAAQLRGVSERTLRRHAKAGLIPGAHQVSGRWLIPAA